MAKKKSKHKTNVMRLLEQKKVPYKVYEWKNSSPANQSLTETVIYKTLVTVGKSGEHYVFVVPINASLDLKKAAKAVSEKSIQMIKERELLDLTGYVHGGCSPIGMKKAFLTTVDQSAEAEDVIIFSGGAVGISVEVDPRELAQFVDLQFVDVKTKEEEE